MLFRVAPSITEARKRNLEEDKKRREEKAQKQERFNAGDVENGPKITKHGSDGGLQKLYFDLSKIQRVIEGLTQVKGKLGDSQLETLEKARIDSGIEHLKTIQEAHKKKIKNLTARPN